MHLSPDFYNPSSIYVPRPGSPAENIVVKGSALIGAFPDRQGFPDRILVYYEGNIYKSVNLDTFAGRCECAHGRMAQRYPTIATASFEKENLIHVGYWHQDGKYVEVLNAKALQGWVHV